MQRLVRDGVFVLALCSGAAVAQEPRPSNVDLTASTTPPIPVRSERTIVSTPHVVPSALNVTVQVAGRNGTWKVMRDDRDATFLEREKELPGLAALVASQARLSSDQNSATVHSEFALAVDLEKPGRKSTVVLKGTDLKVPTVRLHKGFEALTIPSQSEPVIRLQDRSGARIYITVPPAHNVPRNEQQLYEYVSGLRKELSKEGKVFRYNEITIPMIDFSRTGDMTEVVGRKLASPEASATITGATFGHQFKLNAKGFRADEASLVSCVIKGEYREYAVNQNFIVWVEASLEFNDPALPATTIIPFAAYLTPESMKEPIY
jgi:hypothetical protein